MTYDLVTMIFPILTCTSAIGLDPWPSCKQHVGPMTMALRSNLNLKTCDVDRCQWHMTLIDTIALWPWSIPLTYDLDPLTCVSVLWRSRVVSLPCPSSVCVYTPSMHSTPVAEVSSRVWPWRDRSVTAAGGRGYTTPRSDAVDSTGKNTTFLLCLKLFFLKRWHAKKKQL